MASPKKRKVRKQIGRVLAKGGTATEPTFGGASTPATAAQLLDLLEIGLYGHDGDGGFTHGAVGSKLKNSPSGASLEEDAGLETVAELDVRMGGTANWDTAMTRYYLTSTTTDAGMSLATKATTSEGILHCPAGPDAKTFPKLEDVSNGSAISFYLHPTDGSGWGAGRSLRVYIENTDADTDIQFLNDDGTSIGSNNGVSAAGTYRDIDRASANATNGIVIRITSDGTGTTALAGWQIAWENRTA